MIKVLFGEKIKCTVRERKGVMVMKKGFIIVITIIFCSFIFFLIGSYGYVKYNLYSIKKETYEYLINEKSYNKDEIYQIDSKLGIGIKYQATVIFEDEKEHVYAYGKADGEIKQIFPYPEMENDNTYKHRE